MAILEEKRSSRRATRKLHLEAVGCVQMTLRRNRSFMQEAIETLVEEMKYYMQRKSS